MLIKFLNYAKTNFINLRFIKFSIVGASGIIVNMGLLFLFTEKLSIPYTISSIFAIETSILTNFILNDIWTWRERKNETLVKRITKYHVSVLIAAYGINWPVLIILTELLDFYYLLANLIGIALGTIFNFIINDLWTFKK